MIPTDISDSISALQTSITTLGDLTTVTRYDVSLVSASADAVVAALDTALPKAAGDLDAGDPSEFAGDLPRYLVGLFEASSNQSDIAAARGLVGRAAFNIAQA